MVMNFAAPGFVPCRAPMQRYRVSVQRRRDNPVTKVVAKTVDINRIPKPGDKEEEVIVKDSLQQAMEIAEVPISSGSPDVTDIYLPCSSSSGTTNSGSTNSELKFSELTNSIIDSQFRKDNYESSAVVYKPVPEITNCLNASQFSVTSPSSKSSSRITNCETLSPMELYNTSEYTEESDCGSLSEISNSEPNDSLVTQLGPELVDYIVQMYETDKVESEQNISEPIPGSCDSNHVEPPEILNIGDSGDMAMPENLQDIQPSVGTLSPLPVPISQQSVELLRSGTQDYQNVHPRMPYRQQYPHSHHHHPCYHPYAPPIHRQPYNLSGPIVNPITPSLSNSKGKGWSAATWFPPTTSKS